MPFTRETAAANALKAQAARKQHTAARLAAEKQALEDARQASRPFDAQRLDRVRAQLTLVDQRILEESSRKDPDAQRIDRLASAQARLSEQERILSGRPLPGSFRPSAPKPSRQAPNPGPLPPEE